MITFLIILGNKKITYELLRRRGSRTLRLSVRPGGLVRVTAPYLCSRRQIESLMVSKQVWLLEKMTALQDEVPAVKRSLVDYKTHKHQALSLIQERLDFFNRHYRFKYKNITIRNQSTRWGSCSKKGNLNFNYRLFHVPAELRDYVIVHELCHIKEMNHSSRFWKLVAETIPDYTARRKALTKAGKLLF